MSNDISIRKNKGQYMTPEPITTMILDTIGYTGPQILTKTIMEPSFGDGSFLISIVNRVIIEGERAGLSKSEIAQIVDNHIFGIEKDVLLYNRAIERLHKLLDTHGIQNVRWNHLICGDTLIAYKTYAGKMDYVVGNPPYIRIHNIPETYREVVKEFRFIDGMIDLYIVFYEIGLLLLNDTGKLGYIAPNSFMKNTSQKAFRNYLVENKIKGAYYYCFEDDHMVFLLIKTKQPQNSIDKRTVKGRIVKDEVVTDHIIAGLSKNGEVPMNILDGFYDSYVISEPDFPYVYTGIAYIIVAALSMLYVFVLAYVVRLWMRPYKNPQAKKLRAYGRRSAVIEQLNTELRDKLYFHYHGIYVTDNFLVATYWFHTDVIRLDDVRYLSKNRVEERGGRELYRLTLSEPETDLFYEIDFREEELIDACVDAIRG